MKLGTLYVYVKPKSDNDRVVDIRINGIPAKLEAIQTNGQFRFKGEVSKSPQKIDITIDEYIRYEDIVQPYPFIFPIVDTNNKVYSWGDKIKVGTEIKFAYGSNLLPQLYELRGKVMFNGNAFDEDSKHIIGKTNIFTLTEAPKYLKDNEPNCILAPQILRIPNASYKILGYIPDLTGKGNHGKINNSAYAGMSGANGYAVDFNSWQKYSGVQITDSKITLDKTHSSQWICYVISNTVVPTFKVMITGIPTGGSLRIFSGSINIVLTNGENTIQGFTANGATGFFIYSGLELDWSNLVIQQIGEYEGSFCLDGVDDFITIPTLEGHGGKQVLMKVNYRLQTGTCSIYDQRTSKTGWQTTFAIVSGNDIAYSLANSGKTYIDGVLNANIKGNTLANITHNLTITNKNVSESNTGVINIGAQAEYKVFAKMALFTFMSFDDISSEDEIKELNDIVGIEGGYVESPDYYFDAYGKSNNLDEDIDYQGSGTANTKGDIYDKSITGLQVLEDYRNGGSIVPVRNRQLTLNNFAFNEESGYGGWLGIGNLTTALNYGSNTTTNNWKRGGTFLKGLNRNTEIGCGYALANWFDNANHILKFKVKITGLIDTDELYICQYNVDDSKIKQQLFNGINEVTLDTSTSSAPGYRYITFRYPPLTNDVDFEFLYEYQNGLVSDGVEDYLSNTAIPAFTDFTVIAKRTPLDPAVNSAFLCKGLDYYNVIAFLLEFKDNSGDYVSSFGKLASDLELPESITYMTPTNYNGKTISKGNAIDKQGLCVGMYQDINFWKGVFYKMMLYSKTIDQLSINMLKNLFERDELIDVNNPIFKKEEL